MPIYKNAHRAETLIPVSRNRFVTYCLILMTCSIAHAQHPNLIPDPGFEVLDSCQKQVDDFSALRFWYNPTSATPDVYNICGNSNPAGVIIGGGVPRNDLGFLMPIEGNGYGGFGAIQFNQNGPIYAEYIATELEVELDPGKQYCFSYYLSLRNKISNVNLKNIRLFFSDDSIKGINYSPFRIGDFSTYTSGSDYIPTDEDWHRVSGAYKAIGGEKFISIGYIGPNPYADISYYDSTYGYPTAYFFVDFIELHQCNVDVIYPNIFSPNDDGINDRFEALSFEANQIWLKVFDRWGTLIFDSKEQNTSYWDGSSWGKECDLGVYFYCAEVKYFATNEVKLFSGNILLIR